jgi:amino acid transporter
LTRLRLFWSEWCLKGVSAVFFAYIGFDAISTTAEEKDPQRDLPRGMMWAIIICTILCCYRFGINWNGKL